MVVVIVLIIVGIVLFKYYTSPTQKLLRELCVGKNPEQKKVIKYFVDSGCLAKGMSDSEYEQLIKSKLAGMNLKKMALDTIGLDEDEVSEIPPVELQGYAFDGTPYIKRNNSGKFVSSKYQITWLFFSSTQVYTYTYYFSLDKDEKYQNTLEYFYKDVTSFSTSTAPHEYTVSNGKNDKKEQFQSAMFKMVVPGDSFFASITDVDNADQILQAMKQKLREKKAM